MKKERTRKMILCALFAALVAVGAFIRIPMPMVPNTMQFLFVMLAGIFLGGAGGLTAMLVYIIVGLVGIPVFTGGGGLGYVLKPTFGYIIGFAAGAFAAGKISEGAEKPGLGRLLAADFTCMGAVYLSGTLYFYLISVFYLEKPIALTPLLINCVFLTAPGDAVMCVLAALLGKRVIPLIRRL